MAARLVDAQAPGPGLRRPATGRGRRRRPERLLTELGLLWLLARALRPGGRAAGRPGRDRTLAGRLPGGRPRTCWPAHGCATSGRSWRVRDESDERLAVRRVWLRGVTHRPAGAGALVRRRRASLAADLVPGTAVEADLCFYPGRLPLRALVAAAARRAAPLDRAGRRGHRGRGADRVRRGRWRPSRGWSGGRWSRAEPCLPGLGRAVVPGRPGRRRARRSTGPAGTPGGWSPRPAAVPATWSASGPRADCARSGLSSPTGLVRLVSARRRACSRPQLARDRAGVRATGREGCPLALVGTDRRAARTPGVAWPGGPSTGGPGRVPAAGVALPAPRRSDDHRRWWAGRRPGDWPTLLSGDAGLGSTPRRGRLVLAEWLA